jgi:excisionase family DNA binding protein
MPQELYSVEQVADLLGLHVRTVRNYVRDGKLPAVRIGKQYRIARADVEALTGQPVAPVATHRHVEVSSIVRIDAIDLDSANRVSTHLTASLNGPRDESQPVRVETVYDEVRASLKVIVLGSPSTSAELLRLISVLTEGEQRHA